MAFLLLSGLPHPGEAALRNNAAIYTLKPRQTARKQQAECMPGSSDSLYTKKASPLFFAAGLLGGAGCSLAEL